MGMIFGVFFGKLTQLVAQFFKLGAGGTWSGEIALTINPSILASFTSQFREGVIIIAGTNGKTTTSLMVKKILEASEKKVVHNDTGANLLNGIVSACISAANWKGAIDADWGVFEVDENSLPIIISNIKYQISKIKIKDQKLIIVLLNLFRDQLDRYGEVDVIAEKWMKALRLASLAQGKQLTLILNADDPLIAHLRTVFKSGKASESSVGRESKVLHFGIENKFYFLNKKEHATDSTFCLNCGGRLKYEGVYFSHLGIWHCKKCKEKRPKPDISKWESPLPGLYNLYNTLAAVGVGRSLQISDQIINNALTHFTPAFGRQEEFEIADKKIKIFLSKNPTGFNASLRTALEMNPKAILLALNDRIPDGRDVSWIWDVDFESIPDNVVLIASGDRVYDMALRIKYANEVFKVSKVHKVEGVVIEPILEKAIVRGLEQLKSGETLYVLSTYSAMLEVRKILTGRKIL